ncbi:MAG: UDP-N-acetylmuramate: L-alanyl-gamma-D-glutamyl-meso-diaminopimelate ligase [Gammaproteobacteria bacterium]
MIQILGIAGTFMAGIASLAKEAGMKVSGCDANIYPPMSTLLDALDIGVQQGYVPTTIPAEVTEFVIGNAMSRGNPMVEHVLEHSLSYTSGPQWLCDNILKGRETYAIAGTHGKTSTSSMLAWLLQCGNLDPGFLIGGKPGNFDRSAQLGKGKAFVVEADEYDTAFFDKRSKFLHYRPTVAVLNNLEFDHADIFDDLDAIKKQFHHLIRTVPGNGRLIVNADDSHLEETLAMGSWTPIITFSTTKANSDWFAQATENDASSFIIYKHQTLFCEVSWNCFGEHNMSNAIAAVAAAHHAGVNAKTVQLALSTFVLPAKRLQTHATKRGFTLYEDFAHHPTAIAKTLETLRKKHPNQKLVAVLEPRSNTMRTSVHAQTLPQALALASSVYYLESGDLGWSLANETGQSPTYAFSTVKQGLAELESNISSTDIVVVMSNGDFGGLVSALTNID